jgi:hypothetical protein
LAFENELKSNKEIYWNKTILNKSGGLKSFDYKSYLNNDLVLKNALNSIVVSGACLIHNVPVNINEIVKVSERIAKIQDSIFGSGNCVVTNQVDYYYYYYYYYYYLQN